jgi:hypothetical protein
MDKPERQMSKERQKMKLEMDADEAAAIVRFVSQRNEHV